MISQKTISTWTEELGRMSKDKTGVMNLEGNSTILELMLKYESEFLVKEPFFVGYMAMLIGGLQTPGVSNSVSHSLLAFGMYMELTRRQEKADKLSKEIL